ncbi:Crp/Fnr family transcriptional regulator [Streptomyces sp. 4N509B]|uniref:Crp/Fnr family transcriptional regulator n=1 Tax=Streptomyces sp. 4N509B TaxID=3457413 RepID=UPI003FD1DB81
MHPSCALLAPFSDCSSRGTAGLKGALVLSDRRTHELRRRHGWPARSFLGSLSLPLRTELLRLGVPSEYRGEEALIREGDCSTHVVLLRTGVTKVTAHLDNGNEVLLAIRVGGDLVGEMAAMDAAPRSATVSACGVVEAIVIENDDLQRFLQMYPEVARSIASMMAERLRWANRRRLEFSGYPVKVRLARVLAELAATHGHQVRQSVVIGVTLSQPELAALTGSAGHTIQKALRELREAGLLTTNARRISVRDLPRLRETAHLPATLT